MVSERPIGVWEDALFLDLRHLKIAGLFAYGDGKRRGRGMPSRRDLDPVEMCSWLGRLNLFDVFYEPTHFGFRLAGTDCVRLLGRDPTGRRSRECADLQLNPASITRAMPAVVGRRCVRFWNHPAEPGMNTLLGSERICLPFAADGEQVNMLLRYDAGLERLH